MATNLFHLRPAVIRASATGKPEPERRKAASSPNWWTPLFGWSSEPDVAEGGGENRRSDVEPESVMRPRFVPGRLTEEKAKKLRMMIAKEGAFHDKMYHSAIASRLASDFSGEYHR